MNLAKTMEFPLKQTKAKNHMPAENEEEEEEVELQQLMCMMAPLDVYEYT